MDIVWQNDDGTVAIWSMDGTSKTSETRITDPNPGPDWQVVGACDCDGDGNSDILFENSGTIGVWPMDGTTVRQTDAGDPNTYIITLDAGHIVGIVEPKIYLQSGTGAITVWTMGADENGNPSIISTDTIEMPGQGWRVQSVSGTDIVIRHTGGTVAVIHGDMSVDFAGPNPGLQKWKIGGAADLNGDGKADIVWEHTTPENQIQPTVWFIGSNITPYGVAFGALQAPTYHIRVVGDFDGDGKTDLVWQGDSGGSAAIWLMDQTDVSITDIGAPE